MKHRILLVHNYYGSENPSGENQAVDADIELLRRRGHEVALFSRHSDRIRASKIAGLVTGGLSTPWNPFAAFGFEREVRRFGPHIVHVHNTFPLISPAVLHTNALGAGRVLTLHNYRIFCAAGVPLRDGVPCTLCLERRSAFSAVRFGCYRGSRPATLPLAASISLHRHLRTWDRVDQFIAFSEFQRRLMATAGLPEDRISIRPNYFPGRPNVVDWEDRGNYMLFVGRLTAEKGVSDLISAWEKWGEQACELRVIGDGPERSRLEAQVRSSGAKVVFAGATASPEAHAAIARAKLLLVPSRCFEGFPMVLREAFAFGTPVAVSDVGPLPTIITEGESGLIFSAADPDNLIQVIKGIWADPSQLQRLAIGSRLEFEKRYNEDVNYSTLMDIYENAIRRRESPHNKPNY